MRLQRSSGLVGHWKFNEKSGIIANDCSRYRNTGTLTGATHLPEWGEKGIVFVRNVDNRVGAGNAASLNLVSNFTYMAWIKPVSADSGYIIAKRSDVGSGYTVLVSSGVFQVVDGNSAFKTLTGTSYILNSWTHIAVVINDTGTSATGYSNGKIGTPVIITQFANVPTQNLFIGSRSGGSLPFNGSIDEVRIYNRALSADEIKRHYNSIKHNYI